jgi:UDP-glucose-4-epimerase GalE
LYGPRATITGNCLMSQTILVTGGAGYVGSHACKALAVAGHRPVVYDNLSRGHREAVRWGPLIVGDLHDTARLAAVLGDHRVAAVMHFAAFAYVGESVSAPDRYYRNNVGGTLALLDAMRTAGVGRIVFSSTCAVYGVPDALPIRESTAKAPLNPYGETKLAIERALHWYAEAYGMRTMALRYFNAAGADPAGEIGEDHEPETHLIPRVLRAALGTGDPVEIYGSDYPTPDGTAIRDYIHVSDLADAHLRALDHLAAGGSGGAVNLGTGSGCSVRQVVAAVERIGGRPVPRREAPRRPGDPPELVADPSLARTQLGWQARCSDLETIIATALAWEARRGGAR